VTFVEADGVTETTVKAAIGTSLLEVAHAYDIELEGACEGSLACSTCHVIVQDQAMYNKLTEPDDDENDMLDLAFGLTETCAPSRSFVPLPLKNDITKPFGRVALPRRRGRLGSPRVVWRLDWVHGQPASASRKFARVPTQLRVFGESDQRGLCM